MDLKDAEVGMKVKILGEHALDYNSSNIEDFYNYWIYIKKSQQIKEQGYGVVTGIHEKMIVVNDSLSSIVKGWDFLPSDLEPYEEQ